MDRLDVHAEIATTELMRPDGTKVPGWVVTAYEQEGVLEPERVVFSGPHGAERAAEYARARYARIGFRMHADPGRMGGAIQPLRAG